MDGFLTPNSSSAAEVHRDEFNSAYATLEQTIRNFSREKLAYEQTIEGLRNQLVMAQESTHKLSLDNQDVLAENKRLLSLHEENEKIKFGLETLINSVERKQEIISETLAAFEEVERSLYTRYDEHEEFVYNLKFRQLQLKGWIEEEMRQNEDLRIALEKEREKCKELDSKINDAGNQIQQQNTEIGKLNQALEEGRITWREEEEKLKATLENERSNFETDKRSLSAELEKVRLTLDDETKNWATEKAGLEAQLHEEKASLTSQLELMKTTLDEEKKKWAKEKADLETQLHAEKASLTSQLELMKTTLDEEKKAFEDEKCSFKKIIDDQTEILKELKQNLDEERAVWKKEEEELRSNMERERDMFCKEKTSLTEQLEQIKTTLCEEKKGFEDEKSSLKKSIDEQTEKIEALNRSLDEEKAFWKKEEKELKSIIERERESFHEEKTSLTEQLVLMKTTLDEETKKLTHCINQRVQKFKSNTTPQTPKTPSISRTASSPAARVFPSPTTPTRTGILKRHSFSVGDKTSRNVSFGPTLVSDFEIQSENSDSSDVPEISSKKEASLKRMKFSENDKLTSSEEKEPGKHSRRYLKRGILQPKAHISH